MEKRREVIKELKRILKMSQETLAKYVIETAKANNFKVETDNKNYIIINPQAKILLSSHLDIVKKAPPKRIKVYYDRILENANKGILGGDDRCGVYIMLDLIKNQFRNYCYAFFYNEEIGCIGSNHFIDAIIDRKIDFDLNSYNCFIGLDRRGNRDCTDYGYENEKLFKIFKDFGYKIAGGSVTDVAILSEFSNISCVNLSVGFYNEHTENEYIILDDLLYTLNILKQTELIEKLSKNKFTYEKDFYFQNYYVYNKYKSKKSKKKSKKSNKKRYSDILFCDDCGRFIDDDEEIYEFNGSVLCKDCYEDFINFREEEENNVK